MRVVLASERPQVQNLLTDVVEEEPGTIVVGQAENATRALVLTRNLRPDVAIIDFNLPYSVGLDTVALSRVSGLDTAQTISEIMPNTRVLIITNLATQAVLRHGLSTDAVAFFSREREGSNIAFKLAELRHEAMLPNALIFANVEVKPWPTPGQKGDEITGKTIFFGIVSILGGGYLIGTLILAPVGALLVLGGVVALCAGVVKKLTTRLWRKESVEQDDSKAGPERMPDFFSAK